MAESAPRDLTLPELEREAARLWSTLGAHAVVWLSGDLGSGKTTFAQALTRAAGARDGARSPTFALLHAYHAPAGAIYHADCYRLRNPGEAADLDLDALALEARAVLIEWPERAAPALPAPDVHLRFAHIDDITRRRVERVR